MGNCAGMSKENLRGRPERSLLWATVGLFGQMAVIRQSSICPILKNPRQAAVERGASVTW